MQTYTMGQTTIMENKATIMEKHGASWNMGIRANNHGNTWGYHEDRSNIYIYIDMWVDIIGIYKIYIYDTI